MSDPKKKQRKTPAQRAQEAYDVAARIADRLDAQWRTASKEADRLEKERAAAVARREFLSKHPDLPKKDPSGTTTSTQPGGTTA